LCDDFDEESWNSMISGFLVQEYNLDVVFKKFLSRLHRQFLSHHLTYTIAFFPFGVVGSGFQARTEGPIGQKAGSLCLNGKLPRHVFRQVGKPRRLPPPEYIKTKNLIGKMEIQQILQRKIKIPNKILRRAIITIFLNCLN
jgi:hypothetical protein